jgi:DNA-directed RNA polymerase specialized sigma24 family protein
MRAWLFTILRNEWVSGRRRSQRRTQLEVLSGREALQQLTPTQRHRWVALQAHQTP